MEDHKANQSSNFSAMLKGRTVSHEMPHLKPPAENQKTSPTPSGQYPHAKTQDSPHYGGGDCGPGHSEGSY